MAEWGSTIHRQLGEHHQRKLLGETIKCRKCSVENTDFNSASKIDEKYGPSKNSDLHQCASFSHTCSGEKKSEKAKSSERVVKIWGKWVKWIRSTAGEHVCVCGSFYWSQTCFIYGSLYSKHLCALDIMLCQLFFHEWLRTQELVNMPWKLTYIRERNTVVMSCICLSKIGGWIALTTCKVTINPKNKTKKFTSTIGAGSRKKPWRK